MASYTEITPSGEGLRIIVKAVLLPGRRKHGKIEVYSTSRYVTLTGNSWPGAPERIEDRQAEVRAIHERVCGAEEPAATPAATDGLDLSDTELISKAMNAENGAKFAMLWYGDWQCAGHPSQSEADLALCSMLAFWTGGDRQRVAALFRQSGLYRDKADRDDYMERAIDKALEGQTAYRVPAAGSANGASLAKATSTRGAPRYRWRSGAHHRAAH